MVLSLNQSRELCFAMNERVERGRNHTAPDYLYTPEHKGLVVAIFSESQLFSRKKRPSIQDNPLPAHPVHAHHPQ